MKTFIPEALASGFSMNEILKFLRDKVSSSEQRYMQREAAGTARPDEMRAAGDIRQRKQDKSLIKAIGGTAAALAPMAMAARGGQAVGAIAGGLMSGEDSRGVEEIGYDEQQLLEYQEPQNEEMQDPRMIEGEERKQLEYKPEGFGRPSGEPLGKGTTDLFRFIDTLVQKGQPPRYAAQRAKRDKRFQGNIQQIEAQFQMPFPDYIEEMYQEQMVKGTPEERMRKAKQERENLRQAQQPKRRPIKEDPRQMDMFDMQRGNDVRSQQMELFQQNQQMLNELMKRLGQ
ncbi:MAG: hypothetical protein PQJ44_06930 [Sphaerochaetaceae bacterium]|nr:hypothetical protein [Sphaerochaetaceae bacterium]